MGQRVVLGVTMGHPLFRGVSWEVRDGMDRLDRVALGGTMGHPLMFHGVPWGLRDGMERWDREFW